MKFTTSAHFSALYFVITRFAAHLVILLLWANPTLSYAADLAITPDGTTNTQVTKTASGIDQINIAPPDINGLSHNSFTDYNVNQSGQIVNNFSGHNSAEIATGNGGDAVTRTQIGGLVTANPNLVNSGSARAILAEVSSNHTSQMRGYVEIAGTKADLIIANPNGIYCNGCGFINADHLLMVSGKSNFDHNGNLVGFDLSKTNANNFYVPLVTVEGLGLDVTRVSSVEIIASSVKLLASVYGSNTTDFSIKTGDVFYNRSTQELTSSTDADMPLFAIDVASLAKIQAGRIYLIATKKGVGVNMPTEVLASNIVNVEANGDVYYSSIKAADEINIKAKGNINAIDANAKILAAKATIASDQTINNLGSIVSNDLTISNYANASSADNNSILNNQGSIAALAVSISNLNQIDNLNSIYGQNSVNIFSQNLNNSSLINSAQNITINTSKSFNNLSKIWAGEVDENSNVTSFGNLTINSGNVLINSGNLQSSNNTDIIIVGSADNFGLIQSLNNSSLVLSGSFNNNGDINSFNKLSFSDNLGSSSLANYSQIVAASEVEISMQNLSNNAQIKSGNQVNITATNVLNSENALIFAKGDLSIFAASIINQNTKPNTNGIISYGLISESGGITIKTDALNNNYGMILGNATSLSSLSSNAVSLQNTLGVFISTASIDLNLGSIDHVITGTITASDVDITANNIINQGNVTATNFIKLNATGDSGISGDGNITNGLANGDNSNIVLAAGSYAELLAKNNINNYGAISATTDLSLTAIAGDIFNYANSQIIGGNGVTSITATAGSIYNNAATSIITANHNLNFSAGQNLNNYGEISAANNLTTNINNNLNNSFGALMWSGGNMNLYANMLTNNSAEIYATNNLTIAKDSNSNKSAAVENISGNIWTYAGDITINAETLTNKRLVDTVDKRLETPLTLDFQTVVDAGWVMIDNWCQGDGCNNIGYDYFATITKNSNSIAANIISGGSLAINSNSINNSTSNISAESDINISTNNLNNQGTTDAIGNVIYRVSFWKVLSGYFMNPLDAVGGHGAVSFRLFKPAGYDYYVYKAGNGRSTGWIEYAPTMTGYHYETFNSYIKSGGSITVTQNNLNTTANIVNGNSVAQFAVADAASEKSRATKVTQVNNIDTYNLSESGAVAVDLSAITSAISNGQSFVGNFKINLDAAATTPLIERRSQFTDVNQFYGSKYYFDALGLNGAQIIANIDRQSRVLNDYGTGATRLLGDAFIETSLILESIRAMTSDALLLNKNITDNKEQIKLLLDNAVTQIGLLGLDAQDVALNGLTKEQANLLTSDIVTFELTTIDGIKVLAPKIYLSQATRDRMFGGEGNNYSFPSLADNSTIFANQNLTINAATANLTNSGSIISNADMMINVGSITNKTNAVGVASNVVVSNAMASNLQNSQATTSAISSAKIISNKNATITANLGDLKNIGAEIASFGALNLSATNGHIVNTSIIQTTDASLLNSSLGNTTGGDSYQLTTGTQAANSGNIASTLIATAVIKGGEINVNSANDFTNLAATITTSVNTLADNSITSGNLNLTSGGDINIATLQLRNRTETSWGGGKKGGIDITDSMTNVGSDMSSAASLTITSNNSSVNITGSNLASADNLSIAAKDDVNITSVQDSTYNYSAGRTGRGKSFLNRSSTTTQIGSELTTTNNGNISIMSGVNNTDTVGEVESKGSINIIASKLITTDKDNNFANDSGSGDVILVARNEVNIASALNTSFSENHASKKGTTVKKTSTEVKSSNTNVQSEITSNNNLSIISGSDTNIIASNLSGNGSGNIVAGTYFDNNTEVFNQDAAVNILNGKDTSYSYSHSTKEKTGFDVTNLAVAAVAIGSAVFTGGTSLAIFSAAGSYSAMNSVEHTNQATTQGSTVETVVKSNLSFNNDLVITSASDLTVKASDLTTTQGDISLTSGKDIKILSDTQNNSSYQYGSTDGLFGSNKKSTTDINTTGNVSSVIMAGSNQASTDGNLELTSVNDTTLQAAKLGANKDITITAAENLYILAGVNSSVISYTNNDETTLNFTNGSSGNFNTEVINTEILAGAHSSNGGSAGNLAVNVGGNILAQYNATSGEAATSAAQAQGINDSMLTRNFADSPELSYINALNPNQTQYKSIDEIAQSWDQTTRGLTETGQVAIAVAAATVAIATGGIGSGVSGAMMTAGATTAATTASISATNASMNADGNVIGSFDDVSKTTLKDTTSEDTIKNMAISAAIAGAASWVMSAANGNPNLETGTYADSKVGMNVEQSGVDGKWYFEGKTPELVGINNAERANFFQSHVVGNQNPVFKITNSSIPSIKSGALGHDAFMYSYEANVGVASGGVSIVTAVPYLMINACAASSSLCAIYVNTKTDKNFLNQK